MERKYTLEESLVKETLRELHADAKGDWKFMIKYAPAILWGMIRGKGMMKTVSPAMLKDAYMPVSPKEGEFLYTFARGQGAKNIVEFGCSFGVGTIYLAAAARDNGGKVVTTEIEHNKCEVATKNLQKAGLSEYVTVLEGDALKTLKDVEDGVDFVFLDGWKDMYNDVLDVLLPKLKEGAVIIGDDITLSDAQSYLDRLAIPNSGFVTTIVNKVVAVSCYIGKK